MSMLPFTRPTLGEEEFSAVREVLQSGWITSGPRVAELEHNLATYIGGDIDVRLFSSATAALEAVLIARGIGPGDEVIIPAMSFVASANVVVRTGATPVFVDVGLESRNLDAETVSPAITEKTRAVMPVHFAGMPVDLAPVYDLAEHENLVVLEDAAQAIGTCYQGRQVGSFGNPVSFSFHPNKNMTTIEGGAIASADKQLTRQLESIRFHGISRDDNGEMQVEAWGGKMNLPDVNAAIGLAQLKKLDGFNAKRRLLAEHYFRQMPRHPALVLPADAPGHSWHMFCVCLDFESLGLGRREVLEVFKKQNILLGMHYPAMHLFGLYRQYGYGRGDFPVAERIGHQTFTLPLFPAMSLDDVDRVASVFHNLLA
ncbi:MAG: DegT/DnrJ/EryC1/StrS aminotransferase family protein [Lysobacterales bacterium]